MARRRTRGLGRVGRVSRVLVQLAMQLRPQLPMAGGQHKMQQRVRVAVPHLRPRPSFRRTPRT